MDFWRQSHGRCAASKQTVARCVSGDERERTQTRLNGGCRRTDESIARRIHRATSTERKAPRPVADKGSVPVGGATATDAVDCQHDQQRHLPRRRLPAN